MTEYTPIILQGNPAEIARQAALAAASADTAAASAALLGSAKWQVSTDDKAWWNPATRTVSFKRFFVRSPEASVNKTFTAASRFTETFSASGAQLLYLDYGAATEANTLIIASISTALPTDGNAIPLALYWNGQLTWFFDFPVEHVNRPALNVQHVGSNLPIVYVKDAAFGVPARTWMVPLALRYRRRDTNNTITTISTIANSASAYTDPTGTYTWTSYAAVTGDQTGENSLYLDVGDNTVKSVPRGTEIVGTDAGYIPLALYHSGGQLQALNGLRVHYAVKDPQALFDRSLMLTMSKGRALAPIRTKLRDIAGGASNTVMKALLLGDSWVSRPDFAEYLKDALEADGFAQTASGWIGLGEQAALGPAVSTISAGWTFVDAAPTGATAQAVGSELNSLDGMGRKTAGTTETWTVTGFLGDALTIYYQKLSGSFRYAIDGGGTTTVTGDSSDTLGKVTLTGLGAGPHDLAIDTVGNAGNVLIHGAYATATSGSGFELSKAGNGSSEGRDWDLFDQYLGTYVTDIAPDLVVILLGTNDQNQSNLAPELGGPSTPDIFITGVKNVVAAVKAAKADTRFLLVTPPANENDTAGSRTPMARFAESAAAYATATAEVDFINFASLWESYALESARGMWETANGLHLEEVGMREFVDRIWREFFAVQGGY